MFERAKRTYPRSDPAFRLPHHAFQNQFVGGVAEVVDTGGAGP